MLSIDLSSSTDKGADSVKVLPLRSRYFVTEKLVQLVMELPHKGKQSPQSNSSSLRAGERSPNRYTHGQRVECVIEDPEVRPDVRINLDKVCAKDRDCSSSGNKGLHQLEKVNGHDFFVTHILQKLCIGQSLPIHLIGSIAIESDHIGGIVVEISESSLG